jgi:parvulin-like peptidyl-prolyl isomerase
MKIGTGIIFAMALAAALCGSRTAAAAGTNAAAAAAFGNPVIARGTGLEITRADLDEAMSGLKAQTRSLTPALILQVQKQMLDRLIETRLLLTKATDTDKAAGKKTAELRITALKVDAGSPEALERQLKTLGLTEAELNAKITREATAQAVLQRELKVAVTDDEAKSYYDTHTFEFEQPEMARVEHILIFTVDPITHAALPGAQLDARRKLGENLVQAARAGTDFAALAKKYSEDPGSKAAGGELPPFPRGQMAPEIDAAAFALTNNQVSDVITTSIGYQIIKLLDKTPPKKTDYLTAIASIRQGLTQKKTDQLGLAYLNRLKKAAAVEILDPDLKPADANGSDNASPTPAADAKF